MSEPSATERISFRVLSYNVRGLRDDQAALAEVVRGTDPDVVCVQEAPKYFRWRAKGAALARRWGVRAGGPEFFRVAGKGRRAGPPVGCALRRRRRLDRRHRALRAPAGRRR